jgi:hypothetical protein
MYSTMLSLIAGLPKASSVPQAIMTSTIEKMNNLFMSSSFPGPSMPGFD